MKVTAPYIRRNTNVQEWGLSATTALLPIAAAAVYMQGANHGMSQGIAVLINILFVSAIFGCVEFLFARVLADKKRDMDFFSFAEGLSVALVLPANLPRLYIAAIAFLMAFLGKQIFEVRFSFFVSFSQLAKFMSLCIFPSYFWHGKSSTLLELVVGKNAVTMGDSCILALCVGFIFLFIKKWPRIYTAYMISGILLVGYCILFQKDLSLVSLAEFFFSDGLLFAILFCGTNPKAVPASFNGQFVYALFIAGIILAGKWFGLGQISIPFSFAFMNFILMLVFQSDIILYFRRKFVWKG